MAGKIHNGPNGPAPCGATPGKGRGCPYDKEGTGANHYDTQEEAQAAFDEKMKNEHGETATVSKKSSPKVNGYPASVSKLVSAIDRGNMSEITELGKNEEIVKIPHEDWKQLETIATSEYEKMKAEDGGQLKRDHDAFTANWDAARALEVHGTPEGIRKEALDEYDKRAQNRLISVEQNEDFLAKRRAIADQAQEMIDKDPNGDPLATRKALSESYIKRHQAMARAGLKVKFAKNGAELTDPNREIAGVKVPVGYDKHKAAYALDGKLLGLDNSNSVAGPQFKHNGDVIKVRPSTSKDPDERVKRNAAKGFKLGYLLTPTSIDVTGEKTPVTQIQRVKMNNIPLPGAGERTK